MSDETFKVVRFYQDPDRDSEVVRMGLTLEEAQAHCMDPQTSSSTATDAGPVARTAQFGPWFDGWTEEVE